MPADKSVLLVTAATEWLNRLRNGTDSYDFCLGKLMGRLKEENLTLVDIGGSGEEIRTLLVNARKESASKRLEMLRKGGYNHHYYETKMMKELSDAGLTLADIGTNIDELRRLLVTFKKGAAADCVKTISMGGNLAFQTALMKKHLSDVNLTLADIGLNEKMLAIFSQEGHEELACHTLITLRRTKVNDGYNAEKLMHHCAAAGLTLADLGTTDDEIAMLLERE